MTRKRNMDEDATEKFFTLCMHAPDEKDRIVGTGVWTTVQRVQKTVEVPLVKLIDKAVGVPVSMRQQVSAVQVVQRSAEMPQFQFI